MSKETNTKQILLPVDFPANHSVSQEKEKESMTIDISGTKLLESLENVNPDGSLGKMLKALLTSTTAWYSDRCKLTWKKKVSKSNVLLFQLQASVLGTKEKEFGLWATPNTMDILPPRSEQATIKQKTTTRKGRTKPANLREQVDQKTMAMYGWMYPTPTTQEIEHPNMILTENGRRLTKDGKNSHSLNLIDTVKMYPTPSAQEAGEGEFLETLTSKDGTPLKPNERAYNPKTNKHVQMTLNRMVKMFPTPTASDIEGGVSKDVQLKDGHFFRENKKGERWGVKLRDAISMFPTPRANEPGRTTKGYGRALGELMEGKQQMFPTPTTRDHKDSTLSPAYQNRNSDSLPIKMMKEGKPGGKLNPEFVEFLMGYPLNWTKIETIE